MSKTVSEICQGKGKKYVYIMNENGDLVSETYAEVYTQPHSDNGPKKVKSYEETDEHITITIEDDRE